MDVLPLAAGLVRCTLKARVRSRSIAHRSAPRREGASSLSIGEAAEGLGMTLGIRARHRRPLGPPTLERGRYLGRRYRGHRRFGKLPDREAGYRITSVRRHSTDLHESRLMMFETRWSASQTRYAYAAD
jgi:hypothetical protein